MLFVDKCYSHLLDNFFISDKQMSIAIDFSYNNYNLDENYSLTMYFTLLTTHIKFNVYWKIIFFALWRGHNIDVETSNYIFVNTMNHYYHIEHLVLTLADFLTFLLLNLKPFYCTFYYRYYLPIFFFLISLQRVKL